MIAALLLPWLTLSSGTLAQPTAPALDPAANGQVLARFGYESVEPVLSQLGARFERQPGEGRPALLATFASGRRAAILFGACDGQGCRALSIQAVWTAPAALTPQRLAALVQGFNQRYGFARAFVGADGRPSLQRYLIADYGFIRGNLAAELTAFSSALDRFTVEVLQAPAQ